MQVTGSSGKPNADLIESVSYSSSNPFFRTEKFRRMLIRYRIEGCHAEHPQRPPAPRVIRGAIARRKRFVKSKFEGKFEKGVD